MQWFVAGHRVTPGWTHWLVPSAQCSCFQIGTTSLRVSINHWPASNAASRCGLLTATATLASPISKCPKRCTTTHSTSGQRRRASASKVGQLPFGHFGIALVIERARAATVGHFACRTQEQDHRPGQRRADLGDDDSRVEWLVSQVGMGSLVTDDRSLVIWSYAVIRTLHQ